MKRMIHRLNRGHRLPTQDRRTFVFRFLICVLCVICGSSLVFAAPPSITYLYPAGAQRGTTVEVTAAGTFDKWPVKLWASGKGLTLAPGKGKGKLSITVAADAVPGTYWLRAANTDGASTLRPFIVGTLPELTETEPNDDYRKPQVVNASAVVVNGKLEKPNDTDCFAVTLKKGQTLVASLEANDTLKSPMDAILQVGSAEGFVLDQNHDFNGLDPQLAFTAPADGTYITRVFAFPSTPNSTIRFMGADTYVYRLTLSSGGFADHTLPLAVPRADPGSVEIVGWNIPDAARRLKVPAALPGEDRVTVFAPGFANPLRLRVEPHGIASGDKPTAPPFSTTLRFEASTTNAKALVLGRKGVPLTVQAESRAFGLSAYPVVTALDKDGKQLARAEPPRGGSDTTLSFTPPADGVYTILVRDLYGGSGPRYAVLVRVLTPEPNYDLTVTGDRFAVPPGKSLDIPVKVSRKSGFKAAIEVVAEGLPDGVTFKVKPPAGKADPGTVVITLSAAKPGPVGAFRLVGRVKDKPALTRIARAPLAEFETTTPELWVNVSDTPVSQPPKKKKR